MFFCGVCVQVYALYLFGSLEVTGGLWYEEECVLRNQAFLDQCVQHQGYKGTRNHKRKSSVITFCPGKFSYNSLNTSFHTLFGYTI